MLGWVFTLWDRTTSRFHGVESLRYDHQPYHNFQWYWTTSQSFAWVSRFFGFSPIQTSVFKHHSYGKKNAPHCQMSSKSLWKKKPFIPLMVQKSSVHELRLLVYSPLFSRWLAEFLNHQQYCKNLQLPRSSDLPVDVKLKTALVHDEHVTRWFNGWRKILRCPLKKLLRLAPPPKKKKKKNIHWKTSKSCQAGLKKNSCMFFWIFKSGKCFDSAVPAGFGFVPKITPPKMNEYPKKRGHHFSGDMLVSERVCFISSFFLFFPFPACLLDFYLLLPSSRWFHFLHPFFSFPFSSYLYKYKSLIYPSRN